jgi:hypothetical protein
MGDRPCCRLYRPPRAPFHPSSALSSPLLVPADCHARLLLLPFAVRPHSCCFLHAAASCACRPADHPYHHLLCPPAPIEHMLDHANDGGNRSMHSGHLEDAKLTHLVDLTIPSPTRGSRAHEHLNEVDVENNHPGVVDRSKHDQSRRSVSISRGARAQKQA